jgi:trimeric autotransporter adhesin
MSFKIGYAYLRYCLIALLSVSLLAATEYKGQIKFGGLPVPGATLTASQGDKRFVAVSGQDGSYSIPDLSDGVWNVQVEMLGFAPLKQDVTVAAGMPAADWDLKMMSLDEMKAIAAPAPPPSISYVPPPGQTPTNTAVPTPAAGKKKAAAAPPANAKSGFQRTDVKASTAPPPSNAPEAPPASSAFAGQDAAELNQRSSDGFLVNGTVNNGASSPFAQNAAFGNNRRGAISLYQFMVGFVIDNSATNARQFSLTGQDTPKPSFNDMQGLASFAGPIRIPRLWKNPPTVFLNYQWLRNRDDTTTSALMPLAAQRNGDFSQIPAPIYDPNTGAPFQGNVIPASRISPQAQSLLAFYPLPNFTAGTSYNYQIPLLRLTDQNSLQSRFNKSITSKDQFFGQFAYQHTSTETPNVFEFVDKAQTQGINTVLNLQHRFTPRTFSTFGFQYSRLSTRTEPYFANRENVSGNAGIMGNNQDPVNWGPPSLTFSSGIQPLTDGVASFNRNQTTAFSASTLWNHGRHNVTYGGDFRRQQFNYLTQQNPRGAFNFTGAATSLLTDGTPVAGTGSGFADFLLGVPDTSQIAYGNADKYFRANMMDAFVTDDWRVGPALTVSAGIRWEYQSPIDEKYGRLVNLDVGPGFSAVAPVVAQNPVGPLTLQKYPDSLIDPDKHNFAPRIGIAWRPLPASSLVVRAGYGVYYNTSVFQSIANQMAQQSPLSTSLSIQNTPTTPLTLANGFNAPAGVNTTTFGIDPHFKIGYAQIWYATVQRDLPGSLVMTATYRGIKGTRGQQEFYPNTYAPGVTSPCPSCPTSFIYMTSNGNSTRESGELQLRRRLHNGLTATLQYAYSKSIDDSSLGGNPAGSGGTTGAVTSNAGTSYGGGSLVAQNWLDLSAERALSNFDQRHLLTVSAQYSTGQGTFGGTLLNGWRGGLFKEWTVTTAINAGSGLPQTPIYATAVPGTGFTGIRPDYTGAPLYNAPPGLTLNPAAYVAPVGAWGNAGRNTITGPNQFTMNASLGRTFRLKDRYSLDLRVDATNPINHVTYTTWNTIILSPQFGTPAGANPMRSLQTTLRLRF